MGASARQFQHAFMSPGTAAVLQADAVPALSGHDEQVVRVAAHNPLPGGFGGARARLQLFARGLRCGGGWSGSGRPGTGTGTTVNPSMPLKSFGLQVYNGSPCARAVAAIMTS